MTKKQDENRDRIKRIYNAANARFIIDGQPYTSIRQVLAIAQSRGWVGTYEALAGRLHRGAHTWDALLKPLQKPQGAASKTVQQRKHDEMADIIARLDARKSSV